MKISRKWLEEYIDISTYSNAEIAEALTRSGVEVEGVTTLSDAHNVVVGQVTSVTQHPNADKLKVCSVLVDNNDEFQVVCGASNVTEYAKVAYAKVGSKLGDREISKVELRGVESYGMLCSLGELGVEERFVDDANKDGIILLPQHLQLGSNVLEGLDLDDTVFELGLTPNRSDCLSIIGVAYELSAILDIPLKHRVVKYPEIENTDELVKLFVSNKDTLYFSLMPLHSLKVGESPQFIKSRLIASGIRPINNIVDITNYVLIETGQPLHAFDLHKSGTDIEVRSGFKGEKLITLDESELTVSPCDIVVANQNENLSLAGVMGGFSSRVTKYTTDILLECAVFESAVIRETVKKTGLRSDSSARFEKGVDRNRCELALKLAVSLLIEYADAKVSVNPVIYKAPNFEYDTTPVELSYQKLCKYLGFKIDVEEVVNILKRLQFSFVYENEIFKVNKLSRRIDIESDVCIIEEIARLYGLENIDPILPKLTVKSAKVDGIDSRVLVIKNLLQGMGYSEAITYSLTNNKKASIELGENQSLVQIANPISSEREFLRKSLLPSLVEAVSYNIDRQNNDVKLYEISQVNYVENGEIKTGSKLAGAVSGHVLEYPLFNFKLTNDFYFVKGSLQKIFGIANLVDGKDYEIIASEDVPNFFHPYQSAKVLLDGELVGYVGKVHPNVTKHDIYVFEVNKNSLKSIFSDNIVVGSVSQLPSIKRDLSIVVPITTSGMSMIKKVSELEIEDLEEIYIHDIYTSEKLLDNKSVTFRLKFSNKERTLTDEDVNNYIDRILTILNSTFKAQLR